MATPKSIIVGTVFVAICIIAGSMMIGDIAYNIGETQSVEFNKTYVHISAMRNLTQDIEAQARYSKIEDPTSVFTIVTTGAYKAARLTFGSITQMNAMFQELFKYIGLPDWVPGLPVLIITISLSLALIYAFMRWRMRL